MSRKNKKSQSVKIDAFAKVEDVALSKLVRSAKNVRHTHSYQSVDELARDILRRGLLQPLIVEAQIDDKSHATGFYEVIAGGRRLKALQILLEKKLISSDLPVPCIIRDASSSILAEDDSFAENIQRVALHPVDQFYAFMAMKEKGMSEAEIAAAYFVSELVVKQRIRLAQVSPTILDEYRDDKLTLDQVIAFTLNKDHERQMQVLDYIRQAPYSYLQSPTKIREMLTDRQVKITDARAVFVGEEAYKEAGGTITRDLFGDVDDTYFDNPALLDRLFAEKLQAEADKVKGEGWKWVVALPERHNPYRYELCRLEGRVAELTQTEQADYDALYAEYENLSCEAEQLEDQAQDIEPRIAELSNQLSAYNNRPFEYSAEDKALSGAFVYVDHHGLLVIDCGYIAAEDESVEAEPAKGDYQVALEAMKGDVIHAEIDKPDMDYSDRLLTDLTRHQTLAVRNKLAQSPHIAITLLLCRLVRSVFASYGTSNADHILQITFDDNALPYGDDEGLQTAPYGQAITDRRNEWGSLLQNLDDGQLWGTIHNWPDDKRLALLAHCVSFGVNLVEGKIMGAANVKQRRHQKDILARELQLDMREEGWTPQADNYFSRCKKSQILDVVAELKDASTARYISSFKKEALAREAERIATEVDWLPAVFRTEIPTEEVTAAQVENTAVLDESAADPVMLEAAE